MVLFPDAPPAQPWELVLVDKIFAKGGDGAQGIARFLQRHVRSSDATPSGAILRADFRRTVLELNVGCDESSFDTVANAVRFVGPRDGAGSDYGPKEAVLSVRDLASRLANIAQSGSGMSAVYSSVGENPMTGFATARVPFRTRREARANAVGVNQPDYYPPSRGSPNAPRAPAASSDPNNLLYDNLAGGGDWVGSPKRKSVPRETQNNDFEFPGSPAARSSFDSPTRRDSRSVGMGGFANLTIHVDGDGDGDDFPVWDDIPMSPNSPKGMSPLRPVSGAGWSGDAPVYLMNSPDRDAMRVKERLRAEDFGKGSFVEKSVTPLFEKPATHFASDAFPTLDTVEKVEEAMRRALSTRTSSQAAAMRLVCGMHQEGGRLPSKGALDFKQFELAMRRVNVMPANANVTAAVFRKHDVRGDGFLDPKEFINYLMPGDFEPTSPSVYRANLVGYTHPVDKFQKQREHGGYDDPSASGAVASAGNTRVRRAQGPAMRQEAALFKRDQRMHVMLPSDAGHGVTAGDSFYEHGAFNAKPAHDLTARRCKAAMLDKLRGENGGDATVKQFVDVFKFFDADGLGVVGVGAFVKGLRRLNVDPSLDTLSALVAKHETHPGSGVVDYRDMAKKVVPPSAQETEFNEKRNGARGERWGADGGDVLWAGYDRVRLEASLTKLQEPSVFDRRKAGDAGYVPMVGSLLELETLLKKKTLERTANSGKSARAWWKYFDRDGSGGLSRSEFETAIARFNIAAAPAIVDEIMAKYDGNGDGLDYGEMLRCLVTPEGVRDRHGDTVSGMRNMRHLLTSEVPVDIQERKVAAPRLTLGAPRPTTRDVPAARVSVVRFEHLLLDWMQSRGSGVSGLRKLFAQMDTDGDGELTPEEFAAGLARMHIYPTPDDLNAIIGKYDVNGSGGVRFDEFLKSVSPEHLTPGYAEGNWQSIAHHAPKPANIEPSPNGLYAFEFEKLLMEKIESKLAANGSARALFRGLDADRSGFVDRGEFKKWLKVMNFHPDQNAFDTVWRRYDPRGEGLMSYEAFVRRISPRHDPNTSVF